LPPRDGEAKVAEEEVVEEEVGAIAAAFSFAVAVASAMLVAMSGGALVRRCHVGRFVGLT
jgi:hypothetical protein